MIIAILVICIFFILPDLYISLALMRGAAWWAHLLLWLPSVIAFVALVAIRANGFNGLKTELFIGCFLCIAFPQMLFLIFSLLGKLVGLAWQPAFPIGNILGAITGILVSLTMFYGLIFGWKKFEVKRVDLTFDNLPAEFEGYRIAQISDLHVGTYGENPDFLNKVVQSVNAEQSDLIVFTGDIINLTSDEIKPFEPVLSGLHAKDGVMAVLGNHDYCLYGMRKRPTNPREMVGKVVQAERQMGWDVLLNEHRIIARDGAQIAVIGVEDIGKPPFPKLGDLRTAMDGLSDTTFKILLSHDPSHWRMEVLPETDIPLMLAGHTHAAQFKIGSWSPARWMYKEWSGEYVEGKQQLYVSKGIGGSLPFRFGATPEIVVFTLHTSFSDAESSENGI